MKYLNLTEGFNPYNVSEGDCIEFKSFFFNGGEPHIKLDTTIFNGSSSDVCVTSRLTSMNEFMMLMVATEALKACGFLKNSFLFIPYFPGGRQDRRMDFGEPLTSKVFANIINGFGYDDVITFDNHSDVSTALIDNCDNLDNHKFVLQCLQNIYKRAKATSPVLISPDAGANKKIKDLAVYLNKVRPMSVVKCDKTRNVKTGAISGFEVYVNDLAGADCVIVDDICDGGGTFIGLAEELKKKNAGNLYLIVSHGIFSQPLDKLGKYFKMIYTTDSWRSKTHYESLKIIPFTEK